MCFLGIPCWAQDLGQFGPTYPIEEEDFLSYLQQKLQKMEASNSLKAHQKTLLKTAQSKLDQPPAVKRIKKTTHPRTALMDPTLTLKADIVLPDGSLLARKGEKINPLSLRGLSKPLLFLEGDDPDQILWAYRQPSNAVWILVKGFPLDLAEKVGRAIYFDQGGVFCRKWDIRQVPAKITQEGMKLKVEEVFP